MATIQTEDFVRAVLLLLDESFDNVRGIYLDRNTSMFETLASISADEASRPVGGRCATLAAQVKHTAFYLDVVERAVRDASPPQVDWEEIWRTVTRVDEEEWRAIQDELRTNYENIQNLIKSTPAWPSEREIAGAIGVVAHTAYHLGEIRQALCCLRS